MTTLSAEQQSALSLAVSLILDAAKEAGPLGAPSGVVYAALSAHGMTLLSYQSIINALTRANKITVENHCISLV